MDNYVLLYHFDDKNTENQFEKEINDKFWRHQIEENGAFKYFGFAAKEEPGVIDEINTILQPIGLSSEDYVALYHTRAKDPDNIKQTMLVGHDEFVENDVKNMSFDAHRNSLTKLLDFDYVKAQPQPPEKKK